MELIIILVVAILAYTIWKSSYSSQSRHRRLIYRLKTQWGQVPKEEYTPEKFKSLKAFYLHRINKENDVDDITWNDVDMDQIFMTMNNTSSAMGEEYLYALLHQLKFEDKDLAERERLISLFSENEGLRLKLQEIMENMGKSRDVSIYEYMNRLQQVPKEDNLSHYFMAISMVAAISVVFFSPLGILLILVCAVTNIIRYYKRKAQIESYFTVVSYIIRMLDCVKQIEALDYKEIKEYVEKLSKAKKSYAGFRKGARVVASKKPTGDMFDVFLDYLRMIFHFDLIKFNRMMNTFENNKEDMDLMFETIGLLDSMIAVASYRELMNVWCRPVLVQQSKGYMKIKELYHPMLDEPVKSSFDEKRCVLITGSNASGKSTFIKTVAINAILAQTIHTVMADSYEASYFKVASSMALTDNIFNNESYYIVEIKSLKRILDRLDNEIPMLCFVDEVLRGTNTLERIAASSEILCSFATANAICFAATHDIELTYILEDYYSNYHFQEQVLNNEIIFDYKLCIGRAVSKNAIKLLGIIGYSDTIIQKAEESATRFLETGEWEKIGKRD